MKAIQTIALGLALMLGLTVAASAQHNPCNPCGGKSMVSDATVFHVDDPMKRNSVTFKSTAPLEDIVGTSNQITGYLSFNPFQPKKGGHGKLIVPVTSLNTGIPLRDEHLAGADWLNAERNGDIVFEITDVEDIGVVTSSSGAKTFDVTAVGDFSLNGVTKRLSVPARVTWLKESENTQSRLPGDLLAVRASFDVTLADYGITGPKGMDLIGNKVGQSVEVVLSLVGSSVGGSMAANPCNPCGDKKAKNPCNPCGAKAMNPCNPCGGM
ncbi:hypothetical protein GF377_02520 [candidate division GN15 bacterium]|nr:hypothetical protein [candidate division GN15 bacterium]